LLSLDLPSGLQLGLRVGINTYIINNSDYYRAFFDDGMQFGLVLDFAVSKWFYIQPSLMYIHTRHRLELPLLLSLKFPAFWLPRLNAGPYLGVSIAGDDNPLFDMGLGLGTGFDIWMFYIGTFFNYGVSHSNGKLGLNVGVNL
jgi:hypothetical protein